MQPNNLSMPLFVSTRFVVITFLVLAGFVLVSPVHAANQCAGETSEGDAACNAITSGTICCAVPGQDNSCMTEAACITAQANAATFPSNQSSPTLQTAQPSNTSASNSSGGGTLVNPLQANNLEELLVKVLQAVVQLGSIFLVLALVWTGFLFVMAQGAEEKISNARSALMWTVIGGVVLLGAQGIALVLQATVNAL